MIDPEGEGSGDAGGGEEGVGASVTPTQAVADHEDNAADDPAVIDPRHLVRERKIRLSRAHLRLTHQIRSLMATPPRATSTPAPKSIMLSPRTSA